MEKNNNISQEKLVNEVETLRQKIAELEIIAQQCRWAEQRLLEEKERANRYLDIAGVIIVALDIEGKVTLINRKGRELLGYDEKEILGKDWFANFLPKDSVKAVKDAFLKIVSGRLKGAERYENDIITKDGDRRAISWYNSYLEDNEGSIVGTLISGEDITERKKDEEAREQSLRLYSTLIHTSPDAIILVDLDGKIIMLNEQTSSLFGLKRKDSLVGKKLIDLIVPQEKDEALKHLQTILDQERIYNIEHTLVRSDNSTFQAEINATLIKDSNREPEAFLAILRDVTERKEAKDIVERSPAVVFCWSAEKGRPVKIVSRNVSQFGYNPEDFTSGKVSWAGIIHPDDLGRLEEELESYAKDDVNEFTQKYRLITKLGQTRWVEDKTKAIISSQGKITHYQGVMLDITEKVEAEQKLLFTQAVVDNMSDMALWIDPKGNIAYANESASSLLGYSSQELLSMTIHDIDSNFPPELWKFRWEEFKHEKNSNAVSYFRTKDGRIFPVEIRGRYMKNNSSEYICVIVRDATEQERIEQALRIAEQEKEVILNSLSEIVVYHDMNMRILWANRAAAESLGLPIDKMLGVHCHQIWTQRGLLTKDCPVITCLKTGKPKEGEVATPDGRFWFIRGYPVKNVEGNIIGAVEVTLDITEQKKAEQGHRKSLEKSRRILEETVSALAATAERRDPYTAGHQRRVSQLACAIANELGLEPERIEGLRLASTIHDVGKVYVPSEILSKPSKLTELEFSIIMTHPQVGYEILKPVEFPWPVAEIVFQHHEKLNGSGYPQGISEKDILDESKILAVADVVEAMASHRPYRASLGIERALEEIIDNKGILYDVKVVDVCAKLFQKNKFKFD